MTINLDSIIKVVFFKFIIVLKHDMMINQSRVTGIAIWRIPASITWARAWSFSVHSASFGAVNNPAAFLAVCQLLRPPLSSSVPDRQVLSMLTNTESV